MRLPIIDAAAGSAKVAAAIREACTDVGFFYLANHGVDAALTKALDQEARRFFAMPLETKQSIAMRYGGRAWRGYFPLGGELTSGYPDGKEGIYFGAELGAEDPRVVAGLPLHGANLFPSAHPELKTAVLEYLAKMTELAHAVMRGVSRSLGLDEDWFANNYTKDPITLFRIFNYPPAQEGWGVGEHTDYGLLTLLLQDDIAGLEVKTREGWIDAPPIEGTLVCNIGDMLDRLTGGRYLSTPHRVRNRSTRPRISYAFFFDPAWSAELVPLPGATRGEAGTTTTRWDGADLGALHGTYGDYLTTKVARVFPELAQAINR